MLAEEKKRKRRERENVLSTFIDGGVLFDIVVAILANVEMINFVYFSVAHTPPPQHSFATVLRNKQKQKPCLLQAQCCDVLLQDALDLLGIQTAGQVEVELAEALQLILLELLRIARQG
jgi:hypothetical protein